MYNFLELYIVTVDIVVHFLHDCSIFIKYEGSGGESYNLACHLIVGIWLFYDMLYKTHYSMILGCM